MASGRGPVPTEAQLEKKDVALTGDWEDRGLDQPPLGEQVPPSRPASLCEFQNTHKSLPSYKVP